MSDEGNWADKAREAIQNCRLPNRRPDRTWGGSGGGADCVICDAPVKSDELEIELEFKLDDDGPAPAKYHVHVHCFRAWEIERHSLERRSGTNGSGDPVPSAPRRGALPEIVGGCNIAGDGGARFEPGRT